MIRPLVGVVSRLFWKIEYYGVENVPEEGGLIIAANHQTYLDPFWLSVTIKGGNRVWPRGWRFPRFAKVTVTYHPLYYAEQCPDEETRACARRESERLASVIGSAL